MPRSHLAPVPTHELSEHPVVKLKYSAHQTGSLVWRLDSSSAVHHAAVVVGAGVVVSLLVVVLTYGVVGGQ